LGGSLKGFIRLYSSRGRPHRTHARLRKQQLCRHFWGLVDDVATAPGNAYLVDVTAGAERKTNEPKYDRPTDEHSGTGTRPK